MVDVRAGTSTCNSVLTVIMRLGPLISPGSCMHCLPVQDLGMQRTQVLVQRLSRIEYQACVAPRLVSGADLHHLLPG